MIRGISELMAESWLSRELFQLKQSSLELPFREATGRREEWRLNPEHEEYKHWPFGRASDDIMHTSHPSCVNRSANRSRSALEAGCPAASGSLGSSGGLQPSVRPRAFLRIRLWRFQALPKLLTAWRGPILAKTNKNRQKDDSHQVSAKLSPRPALYDPHKDTFMSCLKNETPLAAEASGLINFPTPNTAQIKAGGKATNPVQQMIPSSGIHQSLLASPSLLGCW